MQRMNEPNAISLKTLALAATVAIGAATGILAGRLGGEPARPAQGKQEPEAAHAPEARQDPQSPEGEPGFSRELRLVYTVNNVGYTDTCG